MIKMIIDGKNIYIYGEKEIPYSLVIINTFQGDGSEIFNALKSLTDKDFCLAVVSDIDWNDEMAPWECPPLYKDDVPCTGGADKYLDKLIKDIVPSVKGELVNAPEKIIIAGYSLAGLFAVYSLYKTDLFCSAVSASGSLWFPDFMEYTDNNSFIKRPEKVYFSLGDKEAKTKNQLLSTVENRTTEIYEKYRNMGIDTVFEMNPGNHFKDASFRLAKGIAWIL
ncbi:MAG: alpha/beta hydrolase [Lachnospiraceae bacterium]|nr:alpha/beta hydrolase [Lachnospiraceae bacterium]